MKERDDQVVLRLIASAQSRIADARRGGNPSAIRAAQDALEELYREWPYYRPVGDDG